MVVRTARELHLPRDSLREAVEEFGVEEVGMEEFDVKEVGVEEVGVEEVGVEEVRSAGPWRR